MTQTADPAEALEPRPPHRRRLWLLVTGVIVAVLVAAGAATFGRYVFRDRPGPQAIETALRHYRALPSPPPVTGERYRFPSPGVYEVEGQGSERVSFPPNSQRDGSVMPGTVSYQADGCWVWRLDYNVAHSEDYEFCPRNSELTLAGSGNTQTWDFGVAKISNRARFTCEPPATVLLADPRPGQTYTRVCTGTSTAIQGQTTTTTTTRIIGVEELSIGGTKRAAIHQRQESIVSGAQTGSETADWWQAATTGLPLRMERHIRIDSRSPLGGTITYTEDGSWQMRTLEPQT